MMGLLLPLLTGVVVIAAHENTYLFASLLFFMLVANTIWQLSVWLTHFI